MTEDYEKGKYRNPEGSAIREYAAATSCFSMMFCIGCALGWSSPSLAILLGPDTPMVITDSDITTIMIWSGVGFGLAPLLILFAADRFGRKNSLLVVTTCMMLSWGLIVAAKDATILVIVRFIAGLAVNLGICLAPMYLGEIASVRLRGALGTIIGTTVNSGLLFMFLAAPHMSLKTTACICLTITTGSMVSLWFIPESPYFLTMIGKINEAEEALEKLRGKEDVAEEMDLIKRTISREDDKEEKRDQGNKNSALKQLITIKGNRRAFYINFLFLFILQMGSYVITMVFGQIVFEAIKTNIPAEICAVIIATIQLICNILTIFVVDRVGRRPLILVSGVLSGACVLLISVYFYLMEYTEIDVSAYNLIAVAAMFVNVFALSFGIMPMQLVLQSETLDSEVKALSICLLGMSAGVLTTVSTGWYLQLAVAWGHSVPFFGFCIITWGSTAIILKILPETKGRNFLEIQRDLNA